MYPAGEFVSRLLTPFGGASGAATVHGSGPEQAEAETRAAPVRSVGSPDPHPSSSTLTADDVPPPSSSGESIHRSSSASSIGPLSPEAHTVLSHLTRNKLRRAAAGRMSGGRGAPSLRQLVLWTNALVGVSSSSQEDWDGEEDAGEGPAGEEVDEGDEEGRKRAEKEWFDNLMEDMVVDDDEADEDDDPPPTLTASAGSYVAPVPVEPAEDERYVNIRFRHRGRAAEDSGFLESPAGVSPKPVGRAAETIAEVDVEDGVALPTTSPPPATPEEPLLFPPRTGASPPPPPAPAVSALTAQLRKPEDVPLPQSPSPSPERHVIVRDLAPRYGSEEEPGRDGSEREKVGEEERSWSSLLECEEVSLDTPVLAAVAVEEEEEDRTSSANPCSWGSGEVPALTPDSSPLREHGFGGRGEEDDEEEAEELEEGCGWHRMLRLRGKDYVRRRPSQLGLASSDPVCDAIDDLRERRVVAEDDEEVGSGSWLLDNAPFASEDHLLSPPPGLDTIELGPPLERRRRRLPAGAVLFPPSAVRSFSVPPAPPLPPLPRSVSHPRLRPSATKPAVVAETSLGCAIEDVLASAASADAGRERQRSSTRSTGSRVASPSPSRGWSGIVRTWYDCVDLGVCASTGLAPFGDVEAPSSSSAPASGVKDEEKDDGGRCRAEEALALVLASRRSSGGAGGSSTAAAAAAAGGSAGGGWRTRGDVADPVGVCGRSRLRDVEAFLPPL